MKYTLEELREMILPMVQSLGNRTPEELTGAIVELFKQDREAQKQVEGIMPLEELDMNIRKILEVFKGEHGITGYEKQADDAAIRIVGVVALERLAWKGESHGTAPR